MKTVLVFFVYLFNHVRGIPIDNSVIGVPEVQCGARSILVNFNTENTFDGHVYVKNFFDDERCRIAGDGGRYGAIELRFDDGTCNVQRYRSAEPKGVYVSTTVVIKFHPKFITKIDRAVRVQCFYMEADKTVDSALDVSMLTTVVAPTFNVPMPICRYEILDGGPTGGSVRFATIGQQVYHKWTCDTETLDTFCMTVYGCYVDDGSGRDQIPLIDNDGCHIDQYLLGPLEYPTDLMAGREAHVFKYADRSNVYFNCQIRISVKEPRGECVRPQCSIRSRGKRANNRNKVNHANSVVFDAPYVHPILVADVELTEQDVPSTLLHPSANNRSLQLQATHADQSIESRLGYAPVCISAVWFGGVVGMCATLAIATVSMATMLCLRRQKYDR